MIYFILAAAVGIAANWICLYQSFKDTPEGPMGAGILLPFTFIPFLFPLLWLVQKIFGWPT